MTCETPLLVALDCDSLRAADRLAAKLDPSLCRLKVGKELFTYAGPKVLEKLHKRGFEVFLDLKFHDIPNTVAGAVRAAAELGVWMVNVHASGGERMMQAAVEAIEEAEAHKPLLIAVTVLTSMETQDLKQIGLPYEPIEQVQRLGRLAINAGMDGLVCSANEVRALRAQLGEKPCLVTPGIRPTGSEQGDQRRIATPASALAAGSSYLVIGRPITQAEDPAAALRDIAAEIA